MSSNKEQIKNIKVKLLKDHSSKYSLGTVLVDGKVELNKAGQNLLKKKESFNLNKIFYDPF